MEKSLYHLLFRVKQKKFYVAVDGKQVGSFDTELEAAIAYDAYVIKNKLNKITNFYGSKLIHQTGHRNPCN